MRVGSINVEMFLVLTGTRVGEFFVLVGFRSDGPKSINPFTADPVKALHFAILV